MTIAVGTTVLYSMRAEDFGSKDVGEEGDQVPAVVSNILSEYYNPEEEEGDPIDGYNIWVLPDGEPMFFLSALKVGTDPGTIQEAGAMASLEARIAALEAVVPVIPTTGTLGTVLGGNTNLAAADFESVIGLTANKTIVYDAAGTIGVYTGTTGADIAVTTISAIPS